MKDQGGPWAGPAEDLERGHGLDIVRRIAADWGAEGGCRSRAMWALLDWPADGLRTRYAVYLQAIQRLILHLAPPS